MRVLPLLLAILLAAPLAAQTAIPTPAPGQLARGVVSPSNPAERYDVYLPSAYVAERTWPVLFVMDPRGRATEALERFRPAAERYGWIVLSSYNTLSDADTAATANERALNTMIADAQASLAIDTRRLYLAGFSGTARFAWLAGGSLAGHIAGVIGAGAGFPNSSPARGLAIIARSPFPFFGAVGTTDFNYEEVAALDSLLSSIDAPHRTEVFEGGHSWPPEAVALRAVEWMELQGMRAGLRARDQRWLDSLRTARIAEAGALEASDPLAALHAYRAATADFAGFGGAEQAEARAAALTRDPRVRRAQREEREGRARVEAFHARLAEELRRLDEAQRPPTLRESLSRVDLSVARRQAADTADFHGSRAARRMLAIAATYAGISAERNLRRGQPARARAQLRIAEQAEPGGASICRLRLNAHLMLRAPLPLVHDFACLARAFSRPGEPF
jgi:predicted esterase